MRIVLINQFFWPDLSATSQLLTDVAQELVAEGHQVRVVCGRGGYAGRSDAPCPKVEINQLHDLRFSKSSFGRFTSYLSFWILCFWKVLFCPRPDVIVTLTTPPLLSLVGYVAKAIRRCRHVIWEMDVYPDLAIALGVIPAEAWTTRLLCAIAARGRRTADCVIALGDCMQERLVELGVQRDRIVVAENWADGGIFRPSPNKSWGDKLTIVYPGNLGLGHDPDTLIAALDRMREARHVRFVFVGGGKGLDEVKAFCASRAVTICDFFPYKDPTHLLRDHFACSHIGLVTQRDSCAGLLVPSKVYPLMAAGLPFVFIGPAGATPNCLIERFGCGWHVGNGDVVGLVSTLWRLAEDRHEVLSAGYRAYQAFRTHYDKLPGSRRVCRGIVGGDSHQETPVAKYVFHGGSQAEAAGR